MGAFVGLLFVVFFSLINVFLWGNGGYDVHLLGVAVPAYSLVWSWIAMIALIYGFNYAVHGGSRYPIGHVIAGWWTANIGMTTLLNTVQYRGIEEGGGLMYDFLAQGTVDLAAILIIWAIVKKSPMPVSVFVVGFAGYLVANLFGHTAGAYNLMAGYGEDITAQAYDAYMYLVFTIMLVLMTAGTGIDALLRLRGSDVDSYRDVRSIIHRVVNRNKDVPQNLRKP